jgi:hypothetical protein
MAQPFRFRQVSFAAPQSLFRPFSFGDVAYKNDALTAGNGLVLSTDFDVKQAAVFPAMDGFKTVRAQFREPSDIRDDHLGGMHSLYIRNLHGQEFLLAIAAHPAIRLVDLKDSPLRVGAQEAVHSRLERDPVAFLAFMQIPVCQQAGQDVIHTPGDLFQQVFLVPAPDARIRALVHP